MNRTLAPSMTVWGWTDRVTDGGSAGWRGTLLRDEHSMCHIYHYGGGTISTEVGSSPCSGGVRRHRSSSQCRSTFHFPFVLSCFPTHLVFISLINCCVFNPLFPPCLCVELFVVSACAHVDWCASGLYPCWLFLYAAGFCIKLLRREPSSALLRLTSLPPDTHSITGGFYSI